MTVRQQVQYWTLGLLIFLVALYFLSAVLLPFVAGMAVAYLMDPTVDKLERHMSRTLATALVLTLFFLCVLLFLLLLVPVVGQQIVGFVNELPRLMDWLKSEVVPLLADYTAGLDSGFMLDLAKSLAAMSGDVAKITGQLISQAWTGGLAFFHIVSVIVITPIVAFYLLRDWDVMVAKLDSWLPRQHRDVIRSIVLDIDKVMSGFLRGQGTVCLILGTFYAIALMAVGLKFGLVIGLLSGLVSFIPFVGAILGLAMSLLPAIAQFWPESNWLSLGLVVGIFAFGQFVEGNFLTPRFLGDRIGLHPVWVMFALLAGGALFGFLGVLLAVPAAAAIGVLVRFSVGKYLTSRLYLGNQTAASDRPADDG